MLLIYIFRHPQLTKLEKKKAGRDGILFLLPFLFVFGTFNAACIAAESHRQAPQGCGGPDGQPPGNSVPQAALLPLAVCHFSESDFSKGAGNEIKVHWTTHRESLNHRKPNSPNLIKQFSSKTLWPSILMVLSQVLSEEFAG